MSIAAINADAFVTEVLKSAQVWAIRDTVGFPTSTNVSGETAMPFWSSKTKAMATIDTVAAYQGFEPVAIELPVFIETWLPGLEKDGLYCGLNWSGKRATGYDSRPKDVLARLTMNQRNPWFPTLANPPV